MRRVFTWLLVFAAILGLSIGAAFGAGTAYGRTTAPKAAPSAAATPAAQATGQSDLSAGPGQGGRSQAQGGQQGGQTARQGTAPVMGVIQSVDGQTIKLTMPGGPEATITLSDSTQVGTVSTLDRSALAAGATALVIGQRGPDGNLTPTYILILPEGFTVR